MSERVVDSFAWLEMPEPGSLDPLFLGLVGAVIIGLFIASVLAWIVVLLDAELLPRPLDDPYRNPFGDQPGFSAEQLRAISRAPHRRDPLRRSFTHDHFQSAGLALRSDAGSDGRSPSSPGAARNFVWWRKRHG